MQIVLLQDVKSLGKKGQVVKVNDGYARNFILPKKLGEEATPANLAKLSGQKKYEEKVAQEQLDDAKKLASEIETKTLVLKVKVGDGGKIFGSVSNKEIAEETKKQFGIELDKKKIQLADPIKTTGDHEAVVKLHRDVTTKLKLKVEEA